MKYSRFEDLPVWKAAQDLYVRLDAASKHPGFRAPGDLCDQLLRAALSVSNNIAEGFERGTTDQLICFLYYAKGSVGEVRSMLRAMARMPRFTDLKSEISDLMLLAENTSRQIQGWAESLQNSEIKGVRHLTDAARGAFDRKQRSDRAWAMNKAMVDKAAEEREQARVATARGAESIDPIAQA